MSSPGFSASSSVHAPLSFHTPGSGVSTATGWPARHTAVDLRVQRRATADKLRTNDTHLNHTRPQNAPHTTHKFRVLLLNARTQPSFFQTDDGVDAETSLSLSLHLYLSSPPLHFILTLTFGQ